jgi:hypothetical protein
MIFADNRLNTDLAKAPGGLAEALGTVAQGIEND